MSTFKRYRVKSGSKSWNDRGPDLLRKQADAEKALAKTVPVTARHVRVRQSKRGGKLGGWSQPMSRRQALRRSRGVELKSGQVFQVGKGKPGKVEVLGVMKCEAVRYMELTGAHPDAEITWSLIHHAHPNVVFAGGYLWKKVAGTDSWSDHAWGDAIDATPRGAGVDNDGLYDWQLRMGKSGNLPVHGYILGSKRGKVKRANAPGFRSWPSGASDSHTWHNHDSIVDHRGARPPRTGGHR
jgi:hypothetical protein